MAQYPTLSAPEGFGTLGGQRIQTTEPDLNVQSPEAVQRHLASLDEPINVPDTVRVKYATPDRVMVGALLKAANGEESGLVGVPAWMAANRLNELGMPSRMDDWTADQWQTALAQYEGQPSVLALLGL